MKTHLTKLNSLKFTNIDGNSLNFMEMSCSFMAVHGIYGA